MCESQVIQYIRSEYLSLDQLAERTGISTQRILTLVEARCLPRHSYEITERICVSSFTGVRDVSEKTARFYAPSHVERLRDFESTASNDVSSLADAVWRDFRERYREELTACGGIADGTVEPEVDAMLQIRLHTAQKVRPSRSLSQGSFRAFVIHRPAAEAAAIRLSWLPIVRRFLRLYPWSSTSPTPASRMSVNSLVTCRRRYTINAGVVWPIH